MIHCVPGSLWEVWLLLPQGMLPCALLEVGKVRLRTRLRAVCTSMLWGSSRGLTTMIRAWNRDLVFHSSLPGPSIIILDTPVESAQAVCEELAGGG